MKKATRLLFACFFIGTTLAAPAVQAAYGILAERSTQRVYLDGVSIDLEAYNIGGYNYVKLRDIGKAVGFNVYWDGSVEIQSDQPYTGEAPPASEGAPEENRNANQLDYSQYANPDVFTEAYTRDAYNAAYYVLSGVSYGDLSRTGTVHFDVYGDRQQFENLLVGIANGVTLSVEDVGEKTYAVYAHEMDWSTADAATDELIREVQALTDREKVRRLNEWICAHMTYDPKKTAGVNEVATANAPVSGECISYARMMNYLCARAGIPCIKVFGESHCWNLIYTDGEWTYTDVSLNDQVSGHSALLCGASPAKQLDDPAGVRFLQELLVPNSTR